MKGETFQLSTLDQCSNLFAQLHRLHYHTLQDNYFIALFSIILGAAPALTIERYRQSY